MVLLWEAEETRYRLAGRSLAETLVAEPAMGVQSYFKSYKVIRNQSDLGLFSQYARVAVNWPLCAI